MTDMFPEYEEHNIASILAAGMGDSLEPPFVHPQALVNSAFSDQDLKSSLESSPWPWRALL